MIWLIFLNWFSARTGTRMFDFTYSCVQCGHESKARVAAEGFGQANIFGSAALAQSLAERNAYQRAYAALFTAQCPECARFHPHFVATFERLGRKQALQNRLRLPVVLGGAALAMVLSAAVPLLTGRPIFWLCVAGLGLFTGALGALVFASPVGVPPWAPPSNVCFWRGATPEWILATSLPVSPGPSAPPAPRAWWQWLHWIGMALGAGAVVIGFLWWATMWSTFYVVNPSRDPITIHIDGEERGEMDGLDHPWTDIRPESFNVSAGYHVVEAFDETGARIERVEIDLSSDTLFVPQRRARTICLVEHRATYRGGRRGADSYELLESDRNVWNLDQIDPGPKWMEPPETYRGAEQVRAINALRVMECTDADELIRTAPASGGEM